MSADDHYKLLETVYTKAPVNAEYAPKIVVTEGNTEIQINLCEKYHHGMHAVHGAVIFKMADDAGFFAANSLIKDVFVLTANFNIHFIRPVASGIIRSVGKVIHRGSRQIITDSICYDKKGRIIAQGRGVYMPSKAKLTDAL